MNYIISIDWFQVTCKRPTNNRVFQGMYFSGTLENDKHNYNQYHLEQPMEFNAMFADALSVRLHDFPIATIYSTPRPTTLDPGLCMIKLANPLLYTPKWIWYLYDVMTGLDWTFHNITRVDLAIDFNEFEQHLNPREFIRRYLRSGQYDPLKTQYWRVGGNKFYTIGTKRQCKDQNGEIDFGTETACDYLRFGTRASGVAVYLYNKTQELNDKGGKQYIRDLWKKGGLTDTDDAPVFRLEFSISPTAMNLKRKLTEEERSQMEVAKDITDRTIGHWQIRRLVMNDFQTQSDVENLFWTYCAHYFHFRTVGYQKMPQNWKDLPLFYPALSPTMKPYLVHSERDSGIAESNAAKRIARLIDTQSMSLEDKLALERSAEILNRYADLHNEIVSPDAIKKSVLMLTEGWDFESLIASNHLPKHHARWLKAYVNQCLRRDLEKIYNRCSALEYAMDLDYMEQELPEIAQLMKNYDRDHGIEEEPADVALFDEMARRNLKIRKQFTEDHPPF